MMDISSLSFRRNAFYTALSLAIGACLVSSARAQDPVPKDRSLDVQWPSTELNRASALQQKLRSRNASPDSLHADALSSIRIPVLVPEKAVEMQNFAVRPVQGGNQYVVSAKADGLKVSVVGSRIASDLPEQSAMSKSYAAPPPDGKYTVTRTETGFLLGLVRYGIPYTITIECSRRGDARCATDRFIRSLADSMTYVGGRQ
jgi:hypothetical protein